MNNPKLQQMVQTQNSQLNEQQNQIYQQSWEIDDRDESLFPERSQIILDYPLMPEYPAFVKQEQVKDDIIEDELRDKIVRTKKQFKYEKMHPIKEQVLDYQNQVEPRTQLDSILQNHEPYNSDLNYSKIEKLSYEYMYDRIEQNLKTFKKIEDLFTIFKKKNDNLNFFLTDDDNIEECLPTNVTICYQKYLKREQKKEEQRKNYDRKNNNDNQYNDTNNKTQNNNLWDYQDTQTKINLVALVDTHSQGKDFFFVSKGDNYELVQKYPKSNYIEIRNQDQVGIFKESDFQQLPIKQSAQSQIQNQSSTFQNSFHNHLDSQIRQQDFLSSQDYSEIINPPKKHSITNNNLNTLQPGKKTQLPKKTTGNLLITPSKNYMNNSLIKNSPQLSTSSSKRY